MISEIFNKNYNYLVNRFLIGFPAAASPYGAGRDGVCCCVTGEVELASDYPSCRAGATEGSASSVSAIRPCLSRVHAQKPQETSAPTASGRRSPKRSLNEPISTAPTAGPARKIMP